MKVSNCLFKKLNQKWLEDAKTKSIKPAEPYIDLPYNFEGIDSVPKTGTSFVGDSIFF